MKAVTWHGTGDVRVDDVPDPRSRSRPTRSSGSPRPAICGSDLHLYEVLGAVHRRGRHPRPRADGDRRGGRRRRSTAHPARRPRRRAVQHLLRALLDVRARAPRRSARRPRSASTAPARRCSATRSSTARCRAGRRSSCACRRPSSGRSRCPRARPTTASSTSPTCCRPRGRRSSTPTSPRAAASLVFGLGPIGQMSRADRRSTAARG